MTRAVNKAARLCALREAQRDGLLEGVSAQEIADAWGLKSRVTAWRDLRALADVEKAYAQLKKLNQKEQDD